MTGIPSSIAVAVADTASIRRTFLLKLWPCVDSR